MTFRLLIESARKLVESSLAAAGYPSVAFEVSEPPRKEFGDLTCNVAFQLGKHAKKPPAKIATELVEVIRPMLLADHHIKSVEPHPAGHINFFADHRSLSKITLGQVLENPGHYGSHDSGHGRHVVIEHTSVNPNKALHVGHVRNVVLGDTLYRMMKATNHRVTVLNYVDDSGLQVADIVVAFKYAGFPVDGPAGKKFDLYVGDDVYVKINEKYEKDPELAEKRKAVLREIEEGKSDIAHFAADVTLRVLQEQLRTCWRMKARYDLLNFESQIVTSRLWIKAFEILKKSKMVRLETEGKNIGCWVIEAKEEEDKILVRSDGTATYIAKDIPYAAWKLGIVEDPFSYKEFTKQWDGSVLYRTAPDGDRLQEGFNGGELVITIIDSRQGRLQRIISQVLAQIGTREGNHQYHHLGYEAVTISSETAKTLGIDIGERQFMHMSGRKGIYVNADYVMDTLHAKAFEEVRTRNPDLQDSRLHEIAEEIAISALRYNMIKQDLDKSITFDIKESLSLEGDTGPYLQYAYARSQRILEKSGEQITSGRFELLAHDSEVSVIKEISKLDLVMEDAVKSLSPKSLARYAYSLATAFNLFYEKVPVLKEENAEVRMARLGLVKAFGITLENSLKILGLTALERM
ncbi:MAG TPA: arginine--tRNA ligase [Nitrososphaera sp.]